MPWVVPEAGEPTWINPHWMHQSQWFSRHAEVDWVKVPFGAEAVRLVGVYLSHYAAQPHGPDWSPDQFARNSLPAFDFHLVQALPVPILWELLELSQGLEIQPLRHVCALRWASLLRGCSVRDVLRAVEASAHGHAGAEDPRVACRVFAAGASRSRSE